MMIAEMAAFYKTEGKTLYEAMQDLYKKYGYYTEKTVSFTMPGKDGMEKMAQLLKDLRSNPPKNVNGMTVASSADYLSQNSSDGKTSFDGLPKADVLKYNLSDGKTYFIVRPSGTEPKIKIYLGTVGESQQAAEQLIETTLKDIEKILGL